MVSAALDLGLVGCLWMRLFMAVPIALSRQDEQNRLQDEQNKL
jgi:hypothetical protein